MGAILRVMKTQHWVQDGLAQSVERSIREMGFSPVSVQHGDAFGLDFAIEDPRTGLFGIGIECDAPRHDLLQHARAREIWRPNVLGRAIRSVHRITSSAWYENRLEEVGRLRAALAHALHEPERVKMSGPKVVRIVTREEIQGNLSWIDACV